MLTSALMGFFELKVAFVCGRFFGAKKLFNTFSFFLEGRVAVFCQPPPVSFSFFPCHSRKKYLLLISLSSHSKNLLLPSSLCASSLLSFLPLSQKLECLPIDYPQPFAMSERTTFSPSPHPSSDDDLPPKRRRSQRNHNIETVTISDDDEDDDLLFVPPPSGTKKRRNLPPSMEGESRSKKRRKEKDHRSSRHSSSRHQQGGLEFTKNDIDRQLMMEQDLELERARKLDLEQARIKKEEQRKVKREISSSSSSLSSSSLSSSSSSSSSRKRRRGETETSNAPKKLKSSASPSHRIPIPMPPPPPPSPTTIMIRIRFPNGKKEERRFQKEDDLNDLYRWTDNVLLSPEFVEQPFSRSVLNRSDYELRPFPPFDLKQTEEEEEGEEGNRKEGEGEKKKRDTLEEAGFSQSTLVHFRLRAQ